MPLNIHLSNQIYCSNNALSGCYFKWLTIQLVEWLMSFLMSILMLALIQIELL